MHPSIPLGTGSRSFQWRDKRSAAPLQFLEAQMDTPEMRLILACCGRALGTVDERTLAEWAAVPFDEAAFSLLCREHRLSLLVNKMLVRPFRVWFSVGMADGFDHGALRIVRSQLQLCDSMLKIHRTFTGDKLRHLFLKGPTLNRLLFGEETLRYSRDLDILIEPIELPRADAALRKLGFSPVGPDPKEVLASSLFLLNNKDISYRKAGAGGSIELHWKTDGVESIMNPGFFDREIQIQHCQFQQESIPMLADIYHVMYLCMHAAKHDWSSLCWLLDIPLFMQKRGVSCDRLLELADRHGLRGPVLEALFLSDRFLGCDYGYGQLEPSGKSALRMARRFQINRRVRSQKAKNLLLAFQKGLLYPKLGKKIGYWSMWALNQWIIKSRKGEARIREMLRSLQSRHP